MAAGSPSTSAVKSLEPMAFLTFKMRVLSCYLMERVVGGGHRVPDGGLIGNGRAGKNSTE